MDDQNMDKKCVGIIAEYNPFHNGHLYHLEQSLSATGAEFAVVAMSGNFVQRGQMAVADKWERAEAAVKSGADLVVEIPAVFACNSAPVFAQAAVEILENLGADWISFGSESGNIGDLREISREISCGTEAGRVEEIIKQKVREGLSYPRARREAVAVVLGDEIASLLDMPNNILAVEYLKNMKRAEAVTIKREGAGHDDMETKNGFASAAAIRAKLKAGGSVAGWLPQTSEKMLQKAHVPSEETLFQMICQKTLTTPAEQLDSVFSGGEGLGNKLKKIIRKTASLDELGEELKSKRYTRTRIDRFLMHVLLDIMQPESYGNYIRVLAFSERGRAYLKEIKKRELSARPIITNINKDIQPGGKAYAALEKDILAADLYNLASGRDLYKNSDYVRRPVKVE